MTRDDDKPRGVLRESGEHDPVDPTRADSFARLVDGLLAGDAIPPAMDAGDRALLETATMIVASTQEVRLSAERSRRVVDEALEQAVTGAPRLSAVPHLSVLDDEESEVGENTDVVDITRHRADRALRALPWVVATVAAAAALLLFISRPEHIANEVGEVASSERLTVQQSSRSADALVGRISKERSDRGSERLDVIYTDRMAGYRDLALAGKRSKGGSR